MQRLDAWLHKSYASSAELAAVERSIQATQTAEAISTQINLAVVQTMEARGGQASSVPTATPALENACVKYGIKITEPAVGYSAVNGQVILEGTFSERPPQDSVQLFVTNEELWWPQRRDRIEFKSALRTWSSIIATEGGIFITVSMIGESGRVLTDYFHQAGDVTLQFPGIKELTSDIIECDRVFVGKQN